MIKNLYETTVIGITGILLVLMGCTSTQQQVMNKKQATLVTGNLDFAMKDLTTQIVNSMTEDGKKKVAILEFSDLENNINKFGKFLAEELITRLFRTKKFEIIEMQLLEKTLQEQKISFPGFIDLNAVKDIGRILGVDAIVLGTITDFGTSLKVNARITSTETGTVFAVAAVEIVKDAAVKNLVNQVSTVQKLKEKVIEEAEEIDVKKISPQIGKLTITGILDDHYDINPGHYYLTVKLNGQVIFDGNPDINHGQPYGGVFLNFNDFIIPFDLNLLQNGRNGLEISLNGVSSRDWFCWDYIMLYDTNRYKKIESHRRWESYSVTGVDGVYEGESKIIIFYYYKLY